MPLCVSVCLSEVCAVILLTQTQTIKEAVEFFSKATTQPRSDEIGTSAAAVGQQRYNGSRESSSCLCARSRGVSSTSVWLVHSRRLNHDNIFTFNAIIQNT